MQKKSLLVIVFILFLSSCNAPLVKTDYYQLPTFTESGVNMIVEIPAGTNLKYEFDVDQKDFTVEQMNGKPRTVDFLPYPGNYGFIPSTYMDPARGGDGDPLDVILMSAAQPTGTVLSVKPIGMLELIDGGELDTKLIAIPADTSLQVIQPQDFQDFLIRYDGARRIIETWFLQYKGMGQTKMKGWQDEKAAMAEIRKWTVEK
jgi:inorganic pyrophosphatase